MVWTDRKSTYPGRVKITREDGSYEYVTIERADEPTELGTPLNAENLNKLFTKEGGEVGGIVSAHSFSQTKGHYGIPVEIGQYLDMHVIGSAEDYDGRLYLDEMKNLYFTKEGMTPQKVHIATTGKYKGTGEATSQTITVGDSGNVLFVINSSYFSFITPMGAICVDGGVSMKTLSSSEVSFGDGVLKISTTSPYVNAAAVEHFYTVL